MAKNVIIPHKGYIPVRNGIYGPINTPISLHEFEIFNLIAKDIEVYEIVNGFRVALTRDNFDKPGAVKEPKEEVTTPPVTESVKLEEEPSGEETKEEVDTPPVVEPVKLEEEPSGEETKEEVTTPPVVEPEVVNPEIEEVEPVKLEEEPKKEKASTKGKKAK